MTQPTSWLSKVLAVVVVIMLVAGAYILHKGTSKTDTTDYSKGAIHNESSLTIAPVENNYPLAFPRCGRLFSVDPAWAKQFDKPEATKGKK